MRSIRSLSELCGLWVLMSFSVQYVSAVLVFTIMLPVLEPDRTDCFCQWKLGLIHSLAMQPHIRWWFIVKLGSMIDIFFLGLQRKFQDSAALNVSARVMIARWMRPLWNAAYFGLTLWFGHKWKTISPKLLLWFQCGGRGASFKANSLLL